MRLRSALAELADAVLYHAASVLVGWWLRLIGRA